MTLTVTNKTNNAPGPRGIGAVALAVFLLFSTISPGLSAADTRLPARLGQMHAKQLFQDPDDLGDVQAIRIVIEQQYSSGQTQAVPPTGVFHSGDRIRFRITPKANGYIAVINQDQNSTDLIFPKVGQDNQSNAGQEFVTPYFRFDEHTGLETTTIVVSNLDSDEIKQIYGVVLAPADQKSLSVFSAKRNRVLNKALSSIRSRGEKQLLQDYDADDSCNYVAGPVASFSEPVGITFHLKHEQ